MRNAVIVAAGDCVVFLVALISANVYLAGAVVGLSVAGLVLVARDWRAQRHPDHEEPRPRGLTPDEFTPDVSDADDTAAMTAAMWADDQGGTQPSW